MFTRILLPVDIAQPDLARALISQTAELVKTSGASVRLIYVRQFIVEAALEYLPRNFFDDEENQALSELETLASGMGLPRERISTASPVGGVYDCVIAAATEFEADLIVIGSNRPAMSTYLLGSNAARIVRYAGCSVLVIR